MEVDYFIMGYLWGVLFAIAAPKFMAWLFSNRETVVRYGVYVEERKSHENRG
jgi:hypothetical protein